MSVNLHDAGNISVFLKIDEDVSLKYISARTFFTEFKAHKLGLLDQELKGKTSQGELRVKCRYPVVSDKCEIK